MALRPRRRGAHQHRQTPQLVPQGRRVNGICMEGGAVPECAEQPYATIVNDAIHPDAQEGTAACPWPPRTRGAQATSTPGLEPQKVGLPTIRR